MNVRVLASWTVAGAIGTASATASAGRPLLTDDAGVVGGQSLQLESWLRTDGKTREAWAVGGIGPIEVLELSVGAALGAAKEDDWTPELAGAVAQAKLLGRDPDPGGAPGLASAVGVFPPLETGAFDRNAWFTYTYLALTEIPFTSERLAFHVNVGAAFELGDDARDEGLLWGIAADVRIAGELHAIAELVSSNPAVDTAAGTAQFGAYYALGDHVQVDATAGKGISGDDPIPLFGTLGLKLSSDPVW